VFPVCVDPSPVLKFETGYDWVEKLNDCVRDSLLEGYTSSPHLYKFGLIEVYVLFLYNKYYLRC